MKRMLDLFSGLNGASQAFINSEEWEVITVDNNPELNPTICMDVDYLIHSDHFKNWVIDHLNGINFDLIWASPPCIEFYKALAPWFSEYDKEPSLDLVKMTKYIIEVLEPKTWVIENTKSGKHFIKSILGEERQKLGPFFLWGNFPKLTIDIDLDHKKHQDTGPRDPLRSNKRAKIPIELSQNLHDVLKYQKTLF